LIEAIFTSIEGLVLSKGGEINALKQTIRDQSASFHQAKYIFGRADDPFPLKYLIIFPRIWSLILVQSVQCGNALVTCLRFADVRIGADWLLSWPRLLLGLSALLHRLG